MKKELFGIYTILLMFGLVFSGCSEADQKRAEESAEKNSMKVVGFSAEDGLEITADLYSDGNSSKPFIILFHQAGWSRGEYRETAPILNSMGFNCIAVDQRSGREVNGIVNETAKRAVAADKGTDYIDAYQDMVAALRYVKENGLAKGKLLVIGSSYSSALGFRLASEFHEDISALLSYAPGEYFEKSTGNPAYISEFAAKVKCPVFITSAASEKKYWEKIYEAVKTEKSSYLPSTEGNHGSRALWKKFEDSDGYWVATRGFLKKFVK